MKLITLAKSQLGYNEEAKAEFLNQQAYKITDRPDPLFCYMGQSIFCTECFVHKSI